MMPEKLLNDKKIALVTGGNRGIGLEICKQLAKKGILVILTCRKVSEGKTAVAQLKKQGINIYYQQLDVANQTSRLRCKQFVEKKFGRLDILVNNAGVFLDSDDDDTLPGETSAFCTSLDILRKTLEVNTCAPFRLCQLFIPLMKKHNYGRIINVSSRAGQLATMKGGDAAYRISKTALNAVTKIFAAETNENNILVNSVHPGWVKTEMGGSRAPLTPEQGAETIVWAATLPDGGPTGKFFFEKKEIEW